MKKINLTKEEKDILKLAESESLSSIKKGSLARYAKAARSTMAKNKTISIRISEIDLLKLKGKAVQEGVPYQTLISSSLHRLVN